MFDLFVQLYLDEFCTYFCKKYKIDSLEKETSIIQEFLRLVFGL